MAEARGRILAQELGLGGVASLATLLLLELSSPSKSKSEKCLVFPYQEANISSINLLIGVYKNAVCDCYQLTVTVH